MHEDSLSPFIIQKIPVRLLRRALVHAQVEIAGRDQPVVAQDLLNMPNGAAIEEERGRDCMTEHVRGHGLRKANSVAEAPEPGMRRFACQRIAASPHYE